MSIDKRCPPLLRFPLFRVPLPPSLGRGVGNGAGNIYVAVGSVSTGSTYFAELSYLEFTSAQLGI